MAEKYCLAGNESRGCIAIAVRMMVELDIPQVKQTAAVPVSGKVVLTMYALLQRHCVEVSSGFGHDAWAPCQAHETSTVSL
jgi:hypothetical protein